MKSIVAEAKLGRSFPAFHTDIHTYLAARPSSGVAA